MSLSVVVLCYNSAAVIGPCLRSLIKVERLTADDAQILVVDNGSSDASRAVLSDLEQAFPGLVEPIYLPRNLGTTLSRNLALQKARGEFLLLLDSDILFEQPVLGQLRARLEAAPQIGIIAPRLVFPDGRPQLSTDVFPTLQRKLHRLLRLRQIERAAGPGSDEQRPVDYAISAFWLLRRDMLERVGFLDPRIFYAPEDVDYCLRCWLAGYQVVHAPDLRVVHAAQERSRQLGGLAFSLRHLLGLGYLFAKHRYLWSSRRLRLRIAAQADDAGLQRPLPQGQP